MSCAGDQLWGSKIYNPNFEHTLNLALNIVNGVGRLDLKGDGLTREGLDEAVVLYQCHFLFSSPNSAKFGGYSGQVLQSVGWMELRTFALLRERVMISIELY